MFISFCNRLRILVFSVFFVLSFSSYAGPPVLGNFTFGQVDWYVQANSPVPFVSDSSWGYMEFEVLSSSSENYYLNVVASADVSPSNGWIVRNFVVLADSLSLQGVDFDITFLGLEEGEELSSISFCYTINSDIVEDDASFPCIPEEPSFDVKNIKNFLYSGMGDVPELDVSDLSIGRPFGIQRYEGQGDVDEVSSYHDVPAVSEGEAQCLPGAFARSISWLDQEYGLNLGKSAQDIYDDLVGKMGIQLGLNTEDRIEEKRKYLDELVREATDGRVGAKTKENWNTDGLCEWMLKEMKTEDVEFAWSWSDSLWGHAVTVTKVVKFEDGSCEIHFRDDAHGGDEQGDGKPDSGVDKVSILNPDGSFMMKDDDGKKYITVGTAALGVSESLPVELVGFEATSNGYGINLTWLTGTEIDNAGFRLWRGIKDQYGGYTDITLLEETASNQDNTLTAIGLDRLSNVISTKGSPREGASYSYVDTCVEQSKTYYYLLEDVSMSDKRAFHWDNIASATATEGTGCSY